MSLESKIGDFLSDYEYVPKWERHYDFTSKELWMEVGAYLLVCAGTYAILKYIEKRRSKKTIYGALNKLVE